ncbi:MAG: hypothetical protein ACOCXA_04710 [Planctomycetota bacterium]
MTSASLDQDRIEQLAAELLQALRDAQEATLVRAWHIGEQLDQALAECEPDVERATISQLARQLCAGGCELTTATLTGYRRLRQAFEREQLSDLVSHGMSATHAQLLADCSSDIRQRLLTDCRQDDGSLCSTRTLKQQIKEAQKEATRTVAVETSSIAASARDQDTPLQAATDPAHAHARNAPQQAMRVVAAAPEQETPQEEHQAAEQQTASAEESSSRPAAAATVRQKGFTQNPLAVVKKADNHAIKLLGQSADLLLALDEVCRFGYDSERSLKNFLGAAESLRASLQSYQQVLPEVLQRLDKSVGSLHIEG